MNLKLKRLNLCTYFSVFSRKSKVNSTRTFSKQAVTSTHGVPYSLPAAANNKTSVTFASDQQHEWAKLLLGGLYTARLPQDVTHVADLGCGSGIWSREFATLHPKAKVTGVDLNPPHSRPDDPQNVRFVPGNILNEWSFANHPFDFIWFRFVVLGMTNWGRLFSCIAQNLKSGGLLECLDFTPLMQANNPTITMENSALLRWYDAFWTRLRDSGLDPDTVKNLRPLVKAAGMEVVKEDSLVIYYGEEAASRAGGSEIDKQIAQMYREDVDSMLYVIVDKFFDDTTVPTREDFRRMTDAAAEDMWTNAGENGFCIRW